MISDHPTSRVQSHFGPDPHGDLKHSINQPRAQTPISRIIIRHSQFACFRVRDGALCHARPILQHGTPVFYLLLPSSHLRFFSTLATSRRPYASHTLRFPLSAFPSLSEPSRCQPHTLSGGANVITARPGLECLRPCLPTCARREY